MAVIPFPGGQNKGHLFWAGYRLYDLGLKFISISYDINDVFIIGKYLAQPFITVGGLLQAAAQLLWNSDDVIEKYIVWVNGIINGNSFLSLLQWASFEFIRIRSDKHGWIYSILTEIVGWFPSFLGNPFGWILGYVRAISWAFSLLVDNPYEFVNQVIRHLRSWGNEFLDNPRGFVINRIAEVMPTIWSFLNNPFEYIHDVLRQRIPQYDLLLSSARNWVIQQIIQYSADLFEFINNPQEYIKRRIVGFFGFDTNFFSNPRYFLFLYIITTVKSYMVSLRETIKDIVIDFILLFI